MAITFLPLSCGIIEDTLEETYTYTFILRNETGQNLQITGDFGPRTELVQIGDIFECEFIGSESDSGGFCSSLLEIRIPETSKGYRCFGTTSQIQGLCFVEDERIFTRFDNTIFIEISTRTYEYVLTPGLLENAFELPEQKTL